jgi:DNA-binding NtrC family response regulator
MTETRQLVIVRQNQVATFAMLAQAFANEPGLRLICDRRLRDRRQSPTSLESEERRRRDRRCDPWKTWGQNDYVLVRVTEATTGCAEATSRPDADGDERTRVSADVGRDVEMAVRSDLPVLISGGDAVSRKSLAHQIHRRGDRGGRPLFVVERDAFIEFFEASDEGVPPPGPIVGGDTRHARRAKGIEGATLLIEEVADLTWKQQDELLAFLTNDLRSRGSRDTRVFSGTSHWLLDRVASEQFRADLFYRLNAIHVVLPSGSARTFR